MEILTVRPSEVRFTQNTVSNAFKNSTPLLETLDHILTGQLKLFKLPKIICTIFQGNLWVVHGNRRLFLYQKLEAHGLLENIKVKVKPFSSYLFHIRYTSVNSGRSVRSNVEQEIEELLGDNISGIATGGENLLGGASHTDSGGTLSFEIVTENSPDIYVGDNTLDGDQMTKYNSCNFDSDVDTLLTVDGINYDSDGIMTFDLPQDSPPLVETEGNVSNTEGYADSCEDSSRGAISKAMYNRNKFTGYCDKSVEQSTNIRGNTYNSSALPLDSGQTVGEQEVYIESDLTSTSYKDVTGFPSKRFRKFAEGYGIGPNATTCSYSDMQQVDCHSNYDKGTCYHIQHTLDAYDRESRFTGFSNAEDHLEGHEDVDLKITCRNRMELPMNNSDSREVFFNSPNQLEEDIEPQTKSWKSGNSLQVSRTVMDRYNGELCITTYTGSDLQPAIAQSRCVSRQVNVFDNMRKGFGREFSVHGYNNIKTKQRNVDPLRRVDIMAENIGSSGYDYKGSQRIVKANPEKIDLNNNNQDETRCVVFF